MAEHEPAVRRFCVATASGAPGLLTLVQRSETFYRLYLVTDSDQGTEIAFAAPGLDEMGLVTDLIAAMRREAVAAGGSTPLLASFHVGMTKVVGEGLGGAAADRALAVVRDPALVAVAGLGHPAGLAVAVTAGLFADLRAEGLAEAGWHLVPSADAWLRLYDPPRGDRVAIACAGG